MLEKQDNILYANFMGINYSLYEIRLQFGVETPNDAGDESKQEIVADIRISPQLAKSANEILAKCIENYEENVGKIPKCE